ncbi:MAG: cytochrome c-type biogenesis protein CcmH [Lysobacter sp.]|nr:cytochrome c-type biogenesis protein CcmH [Lysobacter sp.]
MNSESPLPAILQEGNRSASPTRALLPPLKKGGRGGFAVALKNLLLATLLTLSCAAPLSAQPANDPAPLQFRDRAEETRFHALVAELRCVMCQNQSLADSNAQIAHDLRREVLALMRQGKDDRQIKQFLVARYGEFVLYRPQVESKTWLLWFGPALVLLAGGVAVAGIVRSRARAASAQRAPADGNDDNEEW